MKTFHFTIGPVQGFVAQARKTRDLWAGSYILSYLSGIAMKAVSDSGGEVVFPSIEGDPLFNTICKGALITDDTLPAARIGSLPNRFKANAEDPAHAARAAYDALSVSWLKIADECHKWLSGKTAIDAPVQEIWNRQVGALWEVAWAVEDGSKFVLEQRKNIRSHYPPDEPGQKCTICGERQALSGKGEVSEWWATLADKADHVFIRKDRKDKEGRCKERLCAICTIKRVFPLVSKDAIGIVCPKKYPSTAYMSVADWFKVLSEKHADTKVKAQLADFLAALKDAYVQKDEEDILPMIREWAKVSPDLAEITHYSGDAFFPDAIRNEKKFELKARDDRDELVGKLTELTKALGTKPTPFYAVLLMDGDSMGKLLNDHAAHEDKITSALAAFTKEAERIVEREHAGKLIYAGGDDVMALVSSDTALACANALRLQYMSAFASHAPAVPGATISAGIVYAHMTTPLRVVMNDARHMLEGVAKKLPGKNAFAVSVWKRGGKVFEFSKKWCGDGHENWAAEAMAIRDVFSTGGTFSNSFFYRIRELLPVIKEMVPDNQIRLLTAEYLKSRDDHGLDKDDPAKALEKTTERVKRLLEFSCGADEFREQGPLFIRFLAQKEVR